VILHPHQGITMAKEAVATNTKTEIRYPDRFNVIILNDNFTPMEFVVSLLIEVFNKNLEQATQITLTVHEAGKAVVGSYGYEIAEQKKDEATLLARGSGYPLKVIVEKM
jgi:ATP-dependent Clp protease adaptor protein ClpS